MNIFEKKEYKTQLFFKDNNRFKFIKRQLLYDCLVDLVRGDMEDGWVHFFNNQLYFPGYKSISADTVTLGFARDIILDPFNKIPIGEAAGEKPKPKDEASLKKWTAKKATNQRHIYQAQRKNTFKEELINNCLLAVLGLMTVAWLISFLKGIYA